MLDATTKLPLKDPALFRQANYIAGAWVQADSGKTIAVRNPATGESVTKAADKQVKFTIAKALKDSVNA